ncbi:MAG: HAMP domain-containing histidine kinase [Chitinophagaceae bacterium]|nr:HAMP domain-containing histidine kinase [Chitinophagaceae bacterium]
MRIISIRIIKNITVHGLRIFLCFILLLFPLSFLFCQTSDNIRHYTNENGLPAIGVTGIQLDKSNGFLWIGTQGGLVRFDGRNFTNFGLVKGGAVASRITLMTQNRQGIIYCEDDNFSVFRIRNNKPEFVTTDTFFVAPAGIRDIVPGNIAASRIVDRVRHQADSLLPEWIAFHDKVDDFNSFSFVYAQDAYHYDDQLDTLLRFPGFKQLFKVDGHVYFEKTGHEIWEYDRALRKLVPVSISGIPALAAGEKEVPGIMWKPGMKEPLLVIGSDIWKVRREGKGLITEPFCMECYPRGSYITCMQVWEEEGLIFMSSEVNGLYVARYPFIKTILGNPGSNAAKVEYAQAELVPGVVVTACGTAFTSKGKLLPAPLDFPRNNIFLAKTGDYWYSLNDTIFHVYPGQQRKTMTALHDNSIRAVYAETNNRLFAISNYSIGEITDDRFRLLYQLPRGSLKNDLDPTDAIEWKPGTIAIATEKLVLFNTENATLDTVHIPGLTTKVRSFLKYKDYFFIGTYGQGFYMYKNGVVKKMPLDKQQHLSFAHCFIPDEKGYCWISTNHGLFKTSFTALIAAYEHDLPEIYYHYFGKEDGIYNTELNGGCQPCGLKMSSGLFSFPSMNGVVVFDPLAPHSRPPSNRIFVDEVIADTMRYQPDSAAMKNLSPFIKDLRFTLSLPHFTNTENIYFSYKLDPYHDDWHSQDIVRNNVLQFGQLPPGSYKLYLRVRNGFEPDQFQTTMIEFNVLKPWYRSAWFYTLCIAALILMIWGLVRWRTASIAARKKELQLKVDEQTKSIADQSRQLENQLLQQEEDNKIKSRLIAIISHDLITPLTFMSLVGKKIRNAFADTDPNYKLADTLVAVTQELESLTVNMLNWIRFHHEKGLMQPERFELRSLVAGSVEIITTLAAGKGVELHNAIPDNTYIEQHKEAIAVIVYNLAMNAMKHTDRGNIRITGQAKDSGYLLTVSDTGKGMNDQLAKLLNTQDSLISEYSIGESKKFQFGFRIIKDLLRIIQGTMKVESEQGHGTEVSIWFPLPGTGDLQKT